MAATKRSQRPLSEDWRKSIQASNIMRRLSDHSEGKVQMTATQINAAKIVLGKCIPDLARTEHTGLNGGAMEVANVDVRGLNDKDLVAFHALLAKAAKTQDES